MASTRFLILIRATPVQGELVSRVVAIHACGELKHVHIHILLLVSLSGQRAESSITLCIEPSPYTYDGILAQGTSAP